MPSSAAAWALVHVITRLELGGAQRICLRQLAAAQLGAGAKYLLYGPGDQLDDEARRLPGVAAWPVPALGRQLHAAADVQALWTLVRLLRRIRRQHPQRRLLVHTHSSKAGILGRLAAAMAGADCIVHTIHGFGHQPHMKAKTFAALKGAERAAAQVTDGLIGVCRANLRRARAEGLLARAQSCLVPCSIDVAAFQAQARPCLRRELCTGGDACICLDADVRAQLQAHNIPPGAPVVLSVACLKPQKDPLALIAVAARVHRHRPDVHFVVAGDGVLRAAVTAAVQAAGLQRNVHLLGWCNAVPAWMARASLLLHTARWEGLPQAFVQALAAGLPVVGTAVDGAAEAIVDGVHGWLRPPGDVAALAQATLEGLARPELLQAMGVAGRERARDFDDSVSLRRLNAFYADLSAQQNRPRRFFGAWNQWRFVNAP